MKGTSSGYDDPSKKAWITLNDETLSRGQWEQWLNEKDTEIASLQQANTELLQAMEAQSEKLGKLKQFVKNTIGSIANTEEAEALLWRLTKLEAQAIAKQWESEAVTTESRFKVGDRVIDENGDIGTVFAVSVDEPAIRVEWDKGVNRDIFWDDEDFELYTESAVEAPDSAKGSGE